jgi:hypothetical protein
MASDWRALCAGPRIEFDGDDVIVALENGRKHVVRMRETELAFEMHTIVAQAAKVRNVPELPLRIWQRNRATQLVGFRKDSRGRVCAEGWVPKAGLTAEEFQFVLHRVAVESDRFEFILTGRDIE